MRVPHDCYLPVRVTRGELAALERLADDPTAWEGGAVSRGEAVRRLVREALAARGVEVLEPVELARTLGQV